MGSPLHLTQLPICNLGFVDGSEARTFWGLVVGIPKILSQSLGTGWGCRQNPLSCLAAHDHRCGILGRTTSYKGMALWPVGNLLWPILGALDYRDMYDHPWQHMD